MEEVNDICVWVLHHAKHILNISYKAIEREVLTVSPISKYSKLNAFIYEVPHDDMYTLNKMLAK